MTSHVIDWLRGPKAVGDVKSRASARKTGAGIWRRIYGADVWRRFLAPVSGACVRGVRAHPSRPVYQLHITRYTALGREATKQVFVDEILTKYCTVY